MDKKSYSKYNLKINLQNTSYFKSISQRTSLANPIKMQVGPHSKGKTALNLPDLENTCRNINSHYCTALRLFMYENVPVCFSLQHRKKRDYPFLWRFKKDTRSDDSVSLKKQFKVFPFGWQCWDVIWDMFSFQESDRQQINRSEAESNEKLKKR